MLPHRPPFLLVDRIFHCDSIVRGGHQERDDERTVLRGPLPDEPVMPGVLIVEAMAQCSGIHGPGQRARPGELLDLLHEDRRGQIQSAKVVPGDTLQFEIHLLEPIRRGVALVEAKAFVGETLACEAVLMAQVVKKKVKEMISKLAYVHPDAKIGTTSRSSLFACIAGDVVIGDDCWVGPGAVIHDGARIGKGCKIHTAASVSCLPQDLKFAGEVTTCEIGDDNDIREYVTISRGTASTGTTRIGSKNLLMAYVHIGHDCIIGSNCVIANRVSLAGEVHVGDWWSSAATPPSTSGPISATTS